MWTFWWTSRPATICFSNACLPLTEELALLLHRSVEVVPEHELNRHIREYVFKEAVEI
jgi:predicted nucleotidyltransferase